MRIAIYAPSLDPIQGGAATLEQDIFKHLVKFAAHSNHEFLIYTNLSNDFKKQLSVPANVRFIELKQERLRMFIIRRTINAFQDWLLQKRWYFMRSWFEKSLLSEKVQFVYYPTNRFISCDMPYLYTVLDIENLTQPGYPEVSLAGEWERRKIYYDEIVPKATYVIAANETGRQQLLKYFHLEPERVFSLPYPSPDFSLLAKNTPLDPHFRQKYHLKNDFIFYPAKIYPHKNHVGILHSLKILKDKYNLKLDVVFSGPDGGNLSHVKAVAKQLGLEHSVHFPGFVPLADIVQFYRHALALTYMSLFGPANIPSMEAFALGCPVINADVPGAKEDQGDAAILVDPTDSEELANKLFQLIQNKKLSGELIERGLTKSITWTMDHYVEHVFKIFDNYEKIRRCWP